MLKVIFFLLDLVKILFFFCVGEPMECEPKMENPGSPDREGGAEGTEGMADCEGIKAGAEETEDSKKRKRKPYRPGKQPRISQNNLEHSHKCLTIHNISTNIFFMNCTRNWRLHGATKEVSHTVEERIFCPAGWRDYIRWSANRENH